MAISEGPSSLRPIAEDDSAPVLLPFPSADLSPVGEIIRDSSHQQSFLEELEMRQDEVLQQLDDLDRRVLGLLDDYLQARQAS
jgi:hypothetical protein